MKNWFEIDKAGLAKILERKGKEFAVFELAQNAWDENSVTSVAITLVEDTAPGYALLCVEDDAPAGFSDLTHAYTLFAESKKKEDPKKRGRFNLGEKLVLALAREATVTTTTGTIRFDSEGRHRSSRKSNGGSLITISLKMKTSERLDALEKCKRLIPPPLVRTTLNGALLPTPEFKATFETPLYTEVADAEGNLVRACRCTEVRVYEAYENRPAAIYEIGIPVCEIEGRYVIDVGQKVPLTMDREEVLPMFRKQLSVAVLNHMATVMDRDDVNTGWITEAVTSPDAKPEALQAYMTQRFGAQRVAYDPSDPEANNIAVTQGYTVVTGSQLSKAAWANVKNCGAILPAGQVTPSPKPFSPDGKPLTYISPDKAMQEMAAYAQRVAKATLSPNLGITVLFTGERKWPFAAAFGPSGILYLNAGLLGTDWFHLDKNQEKIDDLLIHEFAHWRALNHLSKEFYDELSRIGAALAKGIREGKL